MKVTAKSQLQLRLAGASFVVLVAVVAGLILWLSNVYRGEIDMTRSGRNSLSESSIAAVKLLEKPIRITSFAGNDPELRERIDRLVNSYHRYKKDIELVYVDPNTEPQRVRDAGIRYYGQLLLEYDGAREVLNELSEEALTNALTRLGHRGERWLVFLVGHGERQPDRGANFDLSKWSEQLVKRGFRTRSLSLAENPQIPENTSVLVIAGPQVDLLPGEVKKIEAFVQQGGNLLWLMDPGSTHGLDALAEQLGIEFEPGTIVDLKSQQLTGHPTALVVSEYGNHPAVSNFQDNTVFPNACGISILDGETGPPEENEGQDDSNWDRQVLIDTRTTSWSETGNLDRAIAFNKGKDIPGPLNVAIAATRKVDDKDQRVTVICDGDFASNAFVMGNGGNLDFAMSIANWLSHDDDYISIPTRTVADRTLQLSGTARTLIMVFFVILLPLALTASGILIWLRRRKR